MTRMPAYSHLRRENSHTLFPGGAAPDRRTVKIKTHFHSRIVVIALKEFNFIRDRVYFEDNAVQLYLERWQRS